MSTRPVSDAFLVGDRHIFAKVRLSKSISFDTNLVRKTAAGGNMQEMLLQNGGPSSSNGLISLPYVKSPLQHSIQIPNSCGETILLQHSTMLTPLLTQQQQQQQAALASPISPS